MPRHLRTAGVRKGTALRSSKAPHVPALEKGIDIVELVSEEGPLTRPEIAARLKRTPGEVFRMLHILEARGYIAGRAGSEVLGLTSRFFSLACQSNRIRHLISRAVPILEDLTESLVQASYISVKSGQYMVAAACVESPGGAGIYIGRGCREDLSTSTPGVAFCAFSAAAYAEASASLSANKKRFTHRCETARRQGGVVEPHANIQAVSIASCPVVVRGEPIAILTIPYFDKNSDEEKGKTLLMRLSAAARDLSGMI